MSDLDSLTSETDTAIGDPQDTAELESRRMYIRQYFRDYISETRELSIASSGHTQTLEAKLERIPLIEEEIIKWEESMARYNDFHRTRRDLYTRTVSILNDASSNKLISGTSKEKWMKRLRNPAIGFKAKQYFVENQLPSYVQNWKKAREHWKLLSKNPHIAHLTSTEVSDIKIFRSESEFIALHYDKKVNLLSKVQAAVNARKAGQSSLYSEAQGVLASAVAAKVMSSDNVGVWLHRLFGHGNSTEDIKKYLYETLKKQYIVNWTRVRYHYDKAELKMNENPPQGFNRLTPEKFLSLSYNQRASYVDEAGRRVRIQKQEDAYDRSKLRNLKLQIRHDLDTEDWDEADQLIATAEELAEGDDVLEVQSMKRYMKAFRSSQHKETAPMETVQQTLNEMRAAFNQIPSSLRSIYLASLTTGYPTFSCLSSLMYNRVWCWEHGHLNAHKEAVRKQTTAEDTRRVVREGHSKRGVENIDLATVNGSEADAAVRDYEQGEWGATIIHYTPESKSKLMSKMSGNSNYAFNYWTTLIPEDVPYEQHAYVVKNVNWVLKRGLRTLQKHNVPFTLTGTSAAVLKDKAAPKSSSSRS